jgi:hypothetical protein
MTARRSSAISGSIEVTLASFVMLTKVSIHEHLGTIVTLA